MDGTFEKMADVALNIRRQMPWIHMVVYHELAVPGLVQFKTPIDVNWWKKNSGPVPGPQTDRLLLEALLDAIEQGGRARLLGGAAGDQ